MSRRTRALAATTALLLLAPGVALAHEGSIKQAAVDGPIAEADEGVGSDNMSFITNLQFDTDLGGSFRGTDLDFHTYRTAGDAVDEGRTLPPRARGQARGHAGGQGQGGTGGGDDTAEERTFAFVGTALNGLHVVEITDRENPEVVARYDCRISQSDVFVFEQGERVLAAYTLDAVSQNSPVEESTCHRDAGLVGDDTRGTFLVDVTDPFNPESVSFLPMGKGTHQVTVHPSGEYLYNSAAVLVTTEPGYIEVYDIGADGTDATAEEPELVDTIELTTGLDSHDMTFNADGTRLYSAALTHSFIIDTTDPTDNAIVSRIFDPAINIHHDAHAVTVDTAYGDQREFMLIGDELGGATATGVCPGGGVHVYDITGGLEQLPLKVGAFFIPEVRVEPGLRCTAHVLDVLEDEQLISIAWYGAGVRILDYSGLGELGPQGLSVGLSPFFGGSLTPGITEIGHFRMPDSDLWSAKVPEVEDDGSFYIYGGDVSRTLDVFRFDADAPRQADGGDFLTAAGTRAITPSLGTPRTLGGGSSDTWKQAFSVRP